MEESAPHWYAIKVFYNKVFELEDLFHAVGIGTYIAVDKVLLKGEAHLMARRHIASLQALGKEDTRYVQEGALIYQRKPIVSSLLFVQADAEALSFVENALRDASGNIKGFIYKDAERKTYSVIPDKQMATFRLVTAKGSAGLDFFSSDDITHCKEGNKVRVTEGPFKGAEGYIKRIRRDRRLLVNIEGIVAVATSFIDPQFLEIVKE